MPTSAEIELQNYTLESEIGRGDLTVVYRGTRKSDGEPVAIKLVPPQFTFDEIFVRRFLEMGKQAARLEHPNIVRAFEAQKEGEHLFLVREWVDARSLAQVLADESPLGPQRTINIARQIASALDYAHQKSIMHGDLSARRVYVAKNDRVIVADFGQMQAIAGTSLVRQGFAIGAPEVLAPERVRGQGPSRQSDLYSLGILCYQMLHGEPPFTGDAAAVLHAQAYEQPKPLYLLNPEVSVQLSETVARMLSKGLELRYATGAEFTRALTVAAEGTAPVRVSSTATGPLDAEPGRPAPVWQKPWFLGLGAALLVIVLLLAGFLGVSAWLALAPPTPQIAADANATP
ncbi:MAG: serine/threonine protein kinase, partial [Chloroflexi bacterium]